MKLEKILTNKYVLYAVLFIAITNVVGYLAVEDYDSLIFFICIGVLSTFFSKNMIINLGVSIIATNIIFAGNRIREGMKNRKRKAKKKKKKDKEELTKKTNPSSATQQESKISNYVMDKLPSPADTTSEAYTQKNIPSSKPAAATESEEDGAIGKRIDYASTLEQAYDNLQNMLGPDGINGLSSETKNLVSQQKVLMQNLNDMGPVLKTAKETLDNLSGNMPNFENLQSMMKQFGGITSKLGGKK